MSHTERRPSGLFLADGTQNILWDLVGQTEPAVGCILAPGDQALAILRTPKGCVARPSDQFQPLCAQHLDTYGVIEVPGVHVVLDLDPNIDPGQSPARLALGYTALDLRVYLESIGIGTQEPTA